MDVVRAGFQRRVEHAAARASHLRVVRVHLHLHVVERFNRRVGDRAVREVGDGHAVECVVVAAARAAAERQQRCVRLILLPIELRISGRNHRRHGRAHEERRATGARQRLQRGVVEDRALRRIRRLDQRRLPGHGDVLFDAPDVHRQVERDERLRADADAGLVDRLVSLQRDFHLVRAGLDGSEHVLAPLVGDRRTRDVGAFIREGHFDARQDAAWILDRSAQPPLESLAEDRRRRRRGDERPECERSPESHNCPPKLMEPPIEYENANGASRKNPETQNKKRGIGGILGAAPTLCNRRP